MASSPIKTFRDLTVPTIGFGTWELCDDEARDGVEDALAAGYRLIDTAEIYDNEEEVGEGLRRSGVPRTQVFLTTKVWWTHLQPDDVATALDGSLERLGVDHVDLTLVHWPNPAVPLADTLGALERLVEVGKSKAFGVSNFPPDLLAEALDAAPGVVCNQVEYHPFLGQEPLKTMAEERDVFLTAYSPLARGQVGEDETLIEIGRAHGKSPFQVALRWLVDQPRVVAVPRSADPEHRRKDLEIFDFELDDEERARIDALSPDDGGRRLIDPDFGPNW